jgi:hypothetical protein
MRGYYEDCIAFLRWDEAQACGAMTNLGRTCAMIGPTLAEAALPTRIQLLLRCSYFSRWSSYTSATTTGRHCWYDLPLHCQQHPDPSVTRDDEVRHDPAQEHLRAVERQVHRLRQAQEAAQGQRGRRLVDQRRRGGLCARARQCSARKGAWLHWRDLAEAARPHHDVREEARAIGRRPPARRQGGWPGRGRAGRGAVHAGRRRGQKARA